MIYLIGGAPRAGKSILAQQLSAALKIGWVSTDLLMELLKVRNTDGPQGVWNAEPAAIIAKADWFSPYLERFIWGANSMAENYIIEGVDFLPAHVAQLAGHYQIRAIFLGCTQMTLDRFTQFPGRSRGYADLPAEMQRQIVQDVPRWSEFIRQESAQYGYPYLDTSGDFHQCLHKAEAIVTADL